MVAALSDDVGRACVSGYHIAVGTWLESDGGSAANINARDGHGRTLLIIAVRNEHAALVRILLSRCATVDLQDRYGESALMAALTYSRASAVRELLAAGAKTELRSAGGWTAMHFALQAHDPQKHTRGYSQCHHPLSLFAEFLGCIEVPLTNPSARAIVQCQARTSAARGRAECLRRLRMAENYRPAFARWKRGSSARQGKSSRLF